MVNERRGLGWERLAVVAVDRARIAVVFVLAYRGIRVAMMAAIVLGVVEIVLFAAWVCGWCSRTRGRTLGA